MSNRYVGLIAVAAACALTACSAPVAGESSTPSPSASRAVPRPSQETSVAEGQLFVDVQGTVSPPGGTAKRSRLVRLDTSIFIDQAGKPRKGPVHVVLNVFPDTVYTADVSLIDGTPGSNTWEGLLDGVKLGTVMAVRVDDAFIVKVASPQGVFEATRVDGDTYRVVEMNQGSMPTED